MLKLSQKRTCNGCKSLGGAGWPTCMLRFNNTGNLNNFGMHSPVPQEPCYKPRTNKELMEAYEYRKDSD